MPDIGRVLIVGGGIGGLCLTKGLAQAGKAVDVIDANRRPIGIGIIVRANTLRALDALGLAQQVIAGGFGYNYLRRRGPAGQIVAERELPPALGPGGPAEMAISRPVFADILFEAARDAGMNFRDQTTVASLQQDADKVDVVFSDGSKGQYDLVVGADGLNSQIRREVFDASIQPRFTGEYVWRVLFPRAPEVDGVTTYESTYLVGLAPLNDQSMYLYATQPAPEGTFLGPEVIREKFRALLDGCPAPIIRNLAAQDVRPEDIYFRPFETVFVDGSWFRNRVMLLGDAAHALTAHLASGAGMAIEDAVVLTELVSEGRSIGDIERIHMERRQPRVRALYEISLELTRLTQTLDSRPQVMEALGRGEAILRQPI